MALKTSLGLFAKWQNKTRVEIMLIEFNRRFSQIEQLVSISMTITHRREPKLSNFVVHSLMFCPEGWTMWIYQPSIKSSLKNSLPIQFISTHFFYNGHSFTTKYTNTHLSHKWYLINSHVFLFRLDLILAFF